MYINQLPLIFQVVGYKNSGKTTLMKLLIAYFSKDFQVGTLKHHGHGGEPAYPEDTDSAKHLQAGSMMSAVQGEKQLQITVKDTASYKLNELIQIYTLLPIDLLLIEGYKHADYPKIVIMKDKEDLPLLRLSNISAVGYWDEELSKDLDYNTFPMQEIEEYLPVLAKHMLERKSYG